MKPFADLALARRLESADAQGCVDYAHACTRLGKADVAILPVGGAQAVYAGADSPVNRIVGLGLNGLVTLAELGQVEEFYRSRGASVQVDVCPLADQSLPEVLGRRGYYVLEFNNALVRSLNAAESYPLPPAEITLRKIAPEEREMWARTVSQGFAEQDDAEAGIGLVFAHMDGAHCFMAWVKGEPAGGGVVAMHQGLAVLFTASTRVAFRQRGVQTALLQARLALAAANGCDLAVTYTLPGSASQRNVERLGFQIAYTKLTMCKS